MSTVFCSNCGRQIEADGRFCAYCGAAQEVEATGGPTPESSAAGEDAPATTLEAAAQESEALTEVTAGRDVGTSSAGSSGTHAGVPTASAAPDASGAAAAVVGATVDAGADASAGLSGSTGSFGSTASSTHGPGSLGYRAPATPLNELRSNVLIANLPLELWLVIALFAIPGIYLAQLSLRAMPDAFRLFNELSGFSGGQKFALVLIILLFMVLALAAALLGIAWMLWRADRVGRGLAYVVIASLASLVIFGDGTTTGEVLSMFAGLVAAAILAWSPAVKEVFTGANAPQRNQPTSIIVARVSMAIWIALLFVASVLDFLLGDIGGKYIAIGVFELLVAAAVLWLYLRLPIGDRTTRAIVSIGAAFAFILILVGRHDTGFVLLLGLTAAIPICLWIPSDARAFYGDGPLVVSTASSTEKGV